MSATTAQILAGNPHPNDGGINPAFALYLHEGDNCRWSMHKINLAESQLARLSVWACDPNQIMADGLLFVAFHASGDQAFRDHLLKVFPAARKEMVESAEIAHVDRLEMLDMIKGIKMPKLVVSVFEGSSLDKAQTGLLRDFKFDCEICEPVSYRLGGGRDTATRSSGELAG
jgi:hypothetical protein